MTGGSRVVDWIVEKYGGARGLKNNPGSRMIKSISTLSDKQLLTLCQEYGQNAKLWKQRFLGLLPEIEHRSLYLQAGCTSLFEFAAKLGGVSREQVKVVLSLQNRFEAMPALKQALTSGNVAISKLARIVSVATPQNQEFLLNKTTILSKSALETFVRDVKRLPGQKKNINKIEYSHQKIHQSSELSLSPDVQQELLEMQNKGINVSQELREFLNQRKQRIQEEKQKVAKELKIQAEGPSRYIPKKVTNLLKQEYGTKCAHEQCINQAVNIHHTSRFSMNPSHNPFFLAPLCKQHHEIAHNVDLKVMEQRRR